MAIDAIGSSTTSTSVTGTGFSGLSSADFTKLIFEELTNQDPLAPNDTNALIQQIANIRSIQSDMDLSDRMGNLVDQQEFTAASNTIGKLVSGITDENTRVTEVVKSVVRTSEGTILALADGNLVAFDRVDLIRDAEPASDTTDDASDDTSGGTDEEEGIES